LKLEARRRLAAGEFPALHAAHLAIAREHGFTSWSALKVSIGRPSASHSPALAQLDWVIARFRDAAAPSWLAPGEDELRRHFGDRMLAAVPAGELVTQIVTVAAQLREGLVVVSQAPLQARVRIGGLEVLVAVDADEPHRITGLSATVLGSRVADDRVAGPAPTRLVGDAPAEIADIMDDAITEVGIPGLAIAGGGPGQPGWTVTRGWADLESATALDPGHRFPAVGVTALVTATAVLRLVADGRLGLDTPANAHLHTVRLADDSITVRELLSHSGGVDSPPPADMFADRVPDLLSLLGPVIGCTGPRGVIQPSNGGYAALGQLITDLTGSPYPDAVTHLVLEPLGLRGPSFPAAAADLGRDAVTGYTLTPDGRYLPAGPAVCTIAAVGGLWATPADLVRLGVGWSSLLPAALVREALTPQTPSAAGGRTVGLGWLINPGGGVAVHAGVGPAATVGLLLRPRDRQVRLIATNRTVLLDPVTERVTQTLETQTA
jgi:CubicO group peptidase (beta-lactamase class C family)